MRRELHRRKRDPRSRSFVVGKRLRLATDEVVRPVAHEPRLLLPELLVKNVELRRVGDGLPTLADLLGDFEGGEGEASEDVLQHIVAELPPRILGGEILPRIVSGGH